MNAGFIDSFNHGSLLFYFIYSQKPEIFFMGPVEISITHFFKKFKKNFHHIFKKLKNY